MALLAGKYLLGEKIGGGGMAEVFRAEVRGAEGFSKPVAVKRMLRSLSSEPNFGQMFVAEARIASKLVHPNIGTVIDFDRADDGRYFLVMELIDGVDLRQLTRAGRLPVSCSAHVIASVLRALDHAHEHREGELAQGVVHRDVSPHNIMVAWNGAVQLLDFGIAKVLAATSVSQSGSLKGKVAYMSPEQAHGHDLDGRSDLFAAGIVLHELLTAERLFRGQSDAETLSLMLTAPIARPSQRAPDVPEALDRITLRLLERNREARYPSARDALRELFASGVIPAGVELQLESVMAERFGRGRAPDPPLPPAAAETGVERPADIGLLDTLQSDALALATDRGLGPVVAPPAAGVSATAAAQPAARAVAAQTLTRDGHGAAVAAQTLTRDGHGAAARPEKAATKRHRLVLLLLAVAAAAVVAVSIYVATQSKGAGAAAVDAAAMMAPAASDAAPSASAPDAAARAAAGVDAGADARAAAAAEADEARDRRRARRPGTVTLTATPWATVTIDGEVVGQTPLTLELPAGRHRIVFSNAELGRTERRRIRLRPGGKESLSVAF